MTKRTRTTLTLRLVVEEFADDDPPTLPGVETIETTADDVTGVRRPPLAKTSGDYFPWSRAGGER